MVPACPSHIELEISTYIFVDMSFMPNESKPDPTQVIPSLKLTFSHLKMDGWKISLSPFGVASGPFAVSFREGSLIVGWRTHHHPDQWGA